MLRTAIVAAFVAVMALVPAYGQDKGKDWCTDAHMKEMEAAIAKMTDVEMKKEATSHLAASRAAMAKNDTATCVEYMEYTHKAIGL